MLVLVIFAVTIIMYATFLTLSFSIPWFSCYLQFVSLSFSDFSLFSLFFLPQHLYSLISSFSFTSCPIFLLLFPPRCPSSTFICSCCFLKLLPFSSPYFLPFFLSLLLLFTLSFTFHYYFVLLMLHFLVLRLLTVSQEKCLPSCYIFWTK